TGGWEVLALTLNYVKWTLSSTLPTTTVGRHPPPIQDYSVDLYLRQRWVEHRLNGSLVRPLDSNDPTLVKMLWKPEVYFPNAKDGDFQYVTVPNVLVRIYPDGSILYILRMKLRFSCMMDMSTFPLDHQTCFIQVASYPIKMYKDLQLPQFQRNVGYHLVQSYLPTSLIVVVSWVSFWLDVDAIPSRVTLGVTTLLTVCSESSAFRDKTPAVSYVKALDIWMGSCTAFVFLALVEFTLVNYLGRHKRRFLFWSTYSHPQQLSRSTSLHQAQRLTSFGSSTKGVVTVEADGSSVEGVTRPCMPVAWRREADLAKKIDQTSRAVFPLLFVAFNLAYWVYYQV
ncbi:Glycine receptor subunit beta-type 4-like 3, partial [Homarus americanus]